MTEKQYEKAAQAYQNNDYAGMLALAQKLIRKKPKDGYAYYLAGVALNELNRLPQAQSAIEKAIKFHSDASNARLLLAAVLRQQNKLQEAEAEFESLRLEFPNHEIVASNYSFLLNDLKRFDDAIAVLKPFAHRDDIGEGICINIGNAYRGLGDFKEAVAYYEKALKMDGKYWAGAKANLAVVDMQEGKLHESRAILLDLHEKGVAPLEAYLNLGIIASRLEQTQEAVEWIKLGEAKGLDSVSAIAIYAHCQTKLGNAQEALRRIRTYSEFDFMLLAVWLSIAQKNCSYDEIREVRPKVLAAIEQGKITGVSEVNLFGLLACEGITPLQHFELAKKAAALLLKNQLPLPLKNKRKERIRIGYLCADFRDHPVAHLMIGVFKNHDRSQFEIFGYNVGLFDDTIYRYRSIAYLDHFKEVADLGFEDLARLIAADEIDVLVDLVGYTENCKPQALLFKPAPVIISYLGFVGTTGMDVVDYIIADDIVLPWDQQNTYTEKPIYLPRCYQATDGTLVVDETVTKQELELPEDKFVFVALNNGYKLNDRFIRIWSTILRACPNSIIWLLATDDEVKKNVINEFATHNIDSARIFFFIRQSKSKFLGALACADLFLDSSPYNAGTTASDSLYAGCPVITLPSDIYSSRMAASIVSHAGLEELVCSTEEEYIAKSIRIYKEDDYRSVIKDKATKAKNTRLFDTFDATICLEAAYITAYENYLSGAAAKPIIVNDPGWIANESHQRPFAGYRLLPDEVEIIEAKLEILGGDKAVSHFRQYITPSATHSNSTSSPEPNSVTTVNVANTDNLQTQLLQNKDLIDMKKQPEQEQEQEEEILNFFNPVFWGVRDPETFADLMRIAAKQTTAYHFADNMFVFQRNNSMLHDKPFMKSWENNVVSTNDKAIIWRRYIKAMAGFHCSHLEGDFVECGAYEGVGAKTVLDYLGGPSFPKTFWLYDMFEHNKKMVNHAMEAHSPKLYDEVVKRFEGYHNVRIFKGFIPDVFEDGCPDKIAYLHIDLNQAPAEIATLETLFERVVPGGMIILDDYEMFYYRAQKKAEDDWFGKRGYKVFPLPTSQGFVIKR
jgi:predicted O-linked N-acetylglucosamine transferase (SPINDLY family)